MAKSIADQLMERRATLIHQAQEVAQRGVTEGRELSVEEQTAFDQSIAEAGTLLERAKSIHEGEEKAHDLEKSFRNVTGRDPEQRGSQEESEFGKWAREARAGDAFDLKPEFRAERKAINSRRGKGEQRAMSASGGIGADSVYNQLWEYAVAMSQILQAGVDVVNTADGNTLPFPVATAHATTSNTPVAASGALTLSDATITTVNSTVAKYGYMTLVPTELVQDTTFDLEGYIARAAARDLARQVGKVANTALIAGFTTVGVTGPVGTTTTLGSQSTVGMGTDLLVDLFHSVLPEYRADASWLMADPTAAIVRKLKASTGDPVWQPSLTAGDPDLILGKPVYIDPNLPSPGVSAKTIYFGEWSALKVRIAGGIRFERSNEAGFANDQVAFRAIVRTGAVAVDTNAVKFLAHSAT